MHARTIAAMLAATAALAPARADPSWEPLVIAARDDWTSTVTPQADQDVWSAEYIAPDWETSTQATPSDIPWQTAVLTVPQPPQPISRARLNTTGRAISLPLPLQEASFQLGDINTVIEPDDTVTLVPSELAALLRQRLSKDELAKLNAAGQQRLTLAALNTIGGFAIDLDPAAMQLTFSLHASSAGSREIQFATDRPTISAATPADVSGFLNYAFTVDQDWGSAASATALSLDLAGATRLYGVVFEAEASLTGPYQTFLCPFEAVCRDVDNRGFKRRATRAVYDTEELDLRVIGGDTTFQGLSSQRALDIMGVSLQHDSALFGHSNSQATHGLNKTLFLEKPATVDVRLNGLPIRTITLPAGTYDLNNIPMTLGANTLDLFITYDDGTREHQTFDRFATQHLLAPGATEWSVAGGLPAVWRDGGRAYENGIAAGGFFKYGLNDTLTLAATAQSDSIVHNAGLGADALTPLGIFSVFATASQWDAPGFAIDTALQSLPSLASNGTTYRLAATYYSPDFRFPGDRQLAESDVLYPAFDTWLTVTASASQKLAFDATALFSARYAFADDTPSTPGSVSSGVDRWSVDAGIARDFYDTTLSITAGYGNDRLLAFGVGMDEEPEFRVGVSILARLGESTTISTAHSFGNEVSQLTAVTAAKQGTAIWRGTVYAENSPERGGAVTAAVAATGAYGEAQLAHTLRQPGYGEDFQRTQFRHSGAIAFAGDAMTAGPPIRGGFAIVRPHQSIDGSEIIVGNADDPRATGTSIKPALIADLPPYTNVQYALDATDTPLGYGIGSGVLSVRSPYKAGYAIEVGSDAALSAVGTLIDDTGAPVQLQTGTATSPDHPQLSVPIFTNAAGRFGGEGFAPGTWTITLALDPSQQFTFFIPEKTAGFHDAATLHPGARNAD